MDSIGNVVPSVQMNTGQIEQMAARLGVSEGQKQDGFEAMLEKAGQDFEAVFMSTLLKEMRNTLNPEDGGLFGSEGSDTMGGMFDMFMGQHMAEAQPIGIGDAITAYMKQKAVGAMPQLDSGIPGNSNQVE